MEPRLIQPTPSAHAFPLLIKHLLDTPRIYSPDQEIVYRDQLRYTYKDLYQRVQQTAAMLTRLGVGPGDTVAIMEWDTHRYLECLFAVPMMGAVLHTINVRLSPEQLIYTINHAEDKLILFNQEFSPLLEAVQEQFETVKGLILLPSTQGETQTALPIQGEYEALMADTPAQYEFPDLDENAMATTFYTTGTTGLPKGVFFSHRQIVLHTYGIMAGLTAYTSQATLSSSDVYLPITPLFHCHAWGLPFLMTLLGAKQVYPGRYEPDVLLDLIAKEGVSFSHCVPTILNMILASPKKEATNLSGWKVIIGGAALPEGLCKTAMDLGINIFTGYGMSETCPVLSLALLKPHMLDWDQEAQVKIRCKTGLPIPNTQIRVVDGANNTLPQDGQTTGEIVARSPWLTQGYIKNEDQSEILWENGWLHTGDIGHMDGEGYVKITDRLKDVIKTGGEWVSSLEIEDIISRHPGVDEVAVVGVPHEKWGETPLAMVTLRKEAQGRVDAKELQAFCMDFVTKGQIPKYGVPNQIIFDQEIPKTSVGKISKKDIRVQYN
ncbi:MAG: fatty acid--CoA ligase [Desulfovibrionales bacterium]|nr:fatty acid--CoA ligase [Desulfovibrionales bacterium]